VQTKKLHRANYKTGTGFCRAAGDEAKKKVATLILHGYRKGSPDPHSMEVLPMLA